MSNGIICPSCKSETLLNRVKRTNMERLMHIGQQKLVCHNCDTYYWHKSNEPISSESLEAIPHK